MDNETIGKILIFSPFVIFVGLFIIMNLIHGWKDAIFKYKYLDNNSELIIMISTTVAIIMIFVGILLAIKQ